MKKFLVILTIAVALVGCKEKVITIKEFKENDTLRSEWLQKCKDDSGFEEGSCKNAYVAEKQKTSERLAKKYLDAAGIKE